MAAACAAAGACRRASPIALPASGLNSDQYHSRQGLSAAQGAGPAASSRARRPKSAVNRRRICSAAADRPGIEPELSGDLRAAMVTARRSSTARFSGLLDHAEISTIAVVRASGASEFFHHSSTPATASGTAPTLARVLPSVLEGVHTGAPSMLLKLAVLCVIVWGVSGWLQLFPSDAAAAAAGGTGVCN